MRLVWAESFEQNCQMIIGLSHLKRANALLTDTFAKDLDQIKDKLTRMETQIAGRIGPTSTPQDGVSKTSCWTPIVPKPNVVCMPVKEHNVNVQSKAPATGEAMPEHRKELDKDVVPIPPYQVWETLETKMISVDVCRAQNSSACQKYQASHTNFHAAVDDCLSQDLLMGFLPVLRSPDGSIAVSLQSPSNHLVTL
jgi:hypothetical protein